MRRTILCAAFAAALLAGCSKSDKPVVLTPEMEAEQKEAQASANKAEYARQKTGQSGKPLTGAQTEALRGKR